MGVIVDADPCLVCKRLRDEAPLYYNERYDCYALSRFDDVQERLLDRRTYVSGKGSVLDEPTWVRRHERPPTR